MSQPERPVIPLPYRTAYRHKPISPDSLPTCPRCGDLCPSGALYCAEDGTRLTLSDGELASLRLQSPDARSVGGRDDPELDSRSPSPVRGLASVTRRRGIGGV